MVLRTSSSGPFISAATRSIPLAGLIRSALHETTHALGFDHEQQRSDRDDYLLTEPTCTTSDWNTGRGFGIDQSSVLVTPYDYDSILQYQSNNSVTDACKQQHRWPILKRNWCTGTTTPITDSDCRWIFRPMQLSIHDVNGITRAYEQPSAGGLVPRRARRSHRTVRTTVGGFPSSRSGS